MGNWSSGTPEFEQIAWLKHLLLKRRMRGAFETMTSLLSQPQFLLHYESEDRHKHNQRVQRGC
jgi:hypothetical protein